MNNTKACAVGALFLIALAAPLCVALPVALLELALLLGGVL